MILSLDQGKAVEWQMESEFQYDLKYSFYNFQRFLLNKLRMFNFK